MITIAVLSAFLSVPTPTVWHPAVEPPSPLYQEKEKPKKQRKEKQPKEEKAPKEKGRGPLHMKVAVTGLSEANAAQTRGSLEKLVASVSMCPACRTAQTEKTCEGCGAATETREVPLLAGIATHPSDGRIDFDLSGAGQIWLSQLRSSLGESKVEIDGKGLELSTPATLVVTGEPSGVDAAAVGRLLEGSGMFASVQAAPAPEKGIVLVRVRSKKSDAPLLSEVAKVLRSGSSPLELRDVVWGEVGAPRQGKADSDSKQKSQSRRFVGGDSQGSKKKKQESKKKKKSGDD